MNDEIERGFDPNIIFSRFLATFWATKVFIFEKKCNLFPTFFVHKNVAALLS